MSTLLRARTSLLRKVVSCRGCPFEARDWPTGVGCVLLRGLIEPETQSTGRSAQSPVAEPNGWQERYARPNAFASSPICLPSHPITLAQSVTALTTPQGALCPELRRSNGSRRQPGASPETDGQNLMAVSRADGQNRPASLNPTHQHSSGARAWCLASPRTEPKERCQTPAGFRGRAPLSGAQATFRNHLTSTGHGWSSVRARSFHGTFLWQEAADRRAEDPTHSFAVAASGADPQVGDLATPTADMAAEGARQSGTSVPEEGEEPCTPGALGLAEEERDPGDEPLVTTAFLEDMLEEMERNAGAVGPEGDQFMASVQLRLADEYLREGREVEESEALAVKAWEYFSNAADRGDIARIHSLRILGVCRARQGEAEEAMDLLNESLAEIQELQRTAGRLRRGSRKGRQGVASVSASASASTSAPGLAGDSLARKLVEGRGEVDDVEEGRRRVATEEYLCLMCFGEIQQALGRQEDAEHRYLAAGRVVQRDGIQGDEEQALRDVGFKLSSLRLEQGSAREALSVAEAAGLGVRPWMSGKGGAWSVWGKRTVPESDAEGQIRVRELLTEKRLLSTIHMTLEDRRAAEAELWAVKSLLLSVGASSLELAAADVSIAEVLLADPSLTEPEAAAKSFSEMNADEWERFEEARRLLMAAAGAQAEELGEQHPLVASTKVSAAEACLLLSDWDEALRLAEDSLKVFDGLLGGSVEGAEEVAFYLPELLSQLSSVLLNLRRLDDAERLVERAVKLLPGDTRDDQLALLGILLDFASQLVALNDNERALRVIDGADETLAHTLAREPLVRADFLHVKASALESLSSREEDEEEGQGGISARPGAGPVGEGGGEAEEEGEVGRREREALSERALDCFLEAKAAVDLAMDEASGQEEASGGGEEAEAQVFELQLKIYSSLAEAFVARERWGEAASLQRVVVEMVRGPLGSEHPAFKAAVERLEELEGLAGSQVRVESKGS